MPRSSSLLLVAAIVVVALVSFGARQALRSSYQADVARRMQLARQSTSGVVQALVDLQSGQLGEDGARRQMSAFAARGHDAVAPLSDAPRLGGSALDPQDASAALAAIQLDRDFGLLQESVDQGYATTLAAYRAVRLAQGSASSPPSPADQQAIRQASTAWLRAYATDLRRVDAAFEPALDDFAGWRQQALPASVGAGDWQAIQARVVQVRQAADAARDRVESLPVPSEAAEASSHYNAAQSRLTAALDALSAWADARGEPARLLGSGDDALAAYRAERDQALASLRQAMASAAG